MNIREKSLAWLDGVLPAQYQQCRDPGLLLRARVLMAMTLMYLSSTVSIASLIAVCNFMGWITLWSAVLSSAVSSCAYGVVLFYFRRTGDLFWSSNIFMLTLFSATMAFTYVTGGVASPVMMILLCVVVCAFMMSGRLGGIFWSLATAIFHMVFYGMAKKGISVMQVVDSNLMDLLELFSWIYAWTFMIGTMALFSSLARNLSATLSEEREQLRIKATYDALTGAYTRQFLTERLRQHITRCHEPGKAFLFLDVDIQPQALLSRNEEETLVKRAVQALQGRYPGRLEPARSSGLSLLAILRDVHDADRASECAAAIYMALRDALDESLVRVQIGAVMVPAYAEDEGEILRAARKASLEAGRSDQSLVLYSDAQRIRLEKWTPRNWVYRRYSEMVAG